MKRFSFLLVLIFATLYSSAQLTQLGQSAVFGEPTKGDAKIILLKNGSTAYIHNNSGNIKLSIYDTGYKLASTKVFSGNTPGLKVAKISRSFEVGDKILIFIEGFVKEGVLGQVPTLVRLIVDGKTGALVEKKKLVELPKIKFTQNYSIGFGGVPIPGFYVRKDKNFDSYAVLINNTFEKESGKVLEVVHYNNASEEIGRAFVSSPAGEYKYLRFNDMIVTDKEVAIMIYAFNTRSQGGAEHDLFVATLKGSDINYKSLPIDEDSDYHGSIGKFNIKSNQYIFFCLDEMSNKEARKQGLKKRGQTTYYSNRIILMDATTKAVKVGEGLPLGKLDEKSREIYGEKKGFSGVPQNLFMNKDGGFTVVLEGLSAETYQRGRTTITKYYLGDLGVLIFDKDARLMSSSFIPKSQMISTMMTKTMSVYPMYHNDYENSTFPIVIGNQFKSFSYLNSNDGSYIFFNDTKKNIDRQAKGKISTTQTVSGQDAYAFKTGGTNTLPTGQEIFKSSDGKHNLGLFCVSDYDTDKDVYATIKLEVVGKSKKARVVWLQPK